MADEIRREDEVTDDNIQHGIDDDPNNDPEKARNLGAVGGAVMGAIAGSAVGPLGAIGGAVVGGIAGGLGSQAAVGAIDNIDNDNNMTGLGDKAQYENDAERDVAYAEPTVTSGRTNYETTTGIGNGEPGIQTGGHANDGTPDTRGMTEKVADTITGDGVDDKTGKRVDGGRMDPSGDNPRTYAYADEPGNHMPGIQTGGHDADGSPDTRGITEKVEDTLTGDNVDDKTGKPVD